MPKKMHKIKAGDIVECVNSNIENEPGRPGGAGWKLGLKFTVSHTSHEDRICWGPGDGGVWRSHLILVPTEWNAKENG